MALLAALVTVLLWASAFVGIRAAGEDLSPGALSLGRLAIGSVLLGVLALSRGGRWPGRSELPLLLTFGVLWFGLYNLALNEAEQRVDAGTAAMLVNVGPVLIALLAGFLLAEGFPRTLLVGCAVAFTGAVVIGLATSERGVAAGWGSVLCVAAAAFYAGGVVAQKPLLSRASALHVTWLACLIGLVMCLPFAPQLVDELGTARPTSIAWMLYLGAFPAAVAFTTWTYALSRTTAGRMGATTYSRRSRSSSAGRCSARLPSSSRSSAARCASWVSLSRGAQRCQRSAAARRQREVGIDQAVGQQLRRVVPRQRCALDPGKLASA